MKKISILLVAVVLNAFGQSLMAQTSFGMTAWGVAAINMANYMGISLGTSFIVLSIIAYFAACLIRNKWIWVELIQSFMFLFAFGFLTDVFIYLVPDLSLETILVRFLLNFTGYALMIFSITLHLRVKIAIHPMDVYLQVIQTKLKSIRTGTYISYISAFSIGILFGLLKGEIIGLHVGTIYALLLSGLIFDFYNKVVLDKIPFIMSLDDKNVDLCYNNLSQVGGMNDDFRSEQ